MAEPRAKCEWTAQQCAETWGAAAIGGGELDIVDSTERLALDIEDEPVEQRLRNVQDVVHD